MDIIREKPATASDFIEFYCSDLNARLFPLRKRRRIGDEDAKKPLVDNWRKRKYRAETLETRFADGHALGWALEAGDLVTHLGALGRLLKAKAIEVLFIDPTYFAITAEQSSMSQVGEVLRTFNEMCRSLDVTKALFRPLRGLRSSSGNTLAVVGGDAFAQQAQAADTKVDQKLQECAKAFSDCQRVCDLCATHCANLLAEGKNEHLSCLLHCRDCATCCAACSQNCASGGPLSAVMDDCCDHCAKACEAFLDDNHMKACAEECRKCEKASKAIAK